VRGVGDLFPDLVIQPVVTVTNRFWDRHTSGRLFSGHFDQVVVEIPGVGRFPRRWRYAFLVRFPSDRYLVLITVPSEIRRLSVRMLVEGVVSVSVGVGV